MILKEGMICYGSEVGYYNFYYPNFDYKITLPTDFVVDKLVWRGYGDHVAVRVVSPKNEIPVTVLWIPEEPV